MGSRKDEKRIAFVLGGMSNGGAERVVSLLANQYAKQGMSVDILTLLSSDCTYHLEPNVTVISLANSTKPHRLQIVNWVTGIRGYYKQHRPYRIVSFFAKINLIVMLALYRHIGDIVVSERNDPSKDGRGPLVRFLTNALYPKTKKVVFQTKWAQSCFRKRVRRNSEIVCNPVSEIQVDAKQKTKTIINVGKLSDQKNHKLLIEAFAKIADDYPDYRLEIYGEGTNRQALEQMINNIPCHHRIVLAGWTSEIHSKVASSELFVLSSNYEGFSNALLEAMMIGTPCISTNCAGSNELIENKVNGLLVPVGEVDELASAMRTLLDYPELASQFAQQGKQDVLKFSVSNVIGHWNAVVE